MSEAHYESSQLAPHSQDAEEAVLGSILINPDAFYEARLLIEPDSFFILRNAWVFEAMIRLEARGDLIDYLTVIEELRKQDRLDDIGGAAYITYLTSNVATSIYAEAYAKIIQSAAVRRRLLDFATEASRLAREEDIETSEVLNRVFGLLLDMVEKHTDKPLTPSDYAVQELIEKIALTAAGELKPEVVPTGTDLDDYLTGGGLEYGAWIVTSDTSGGKSQYKHNLMVNIAIGDEERGLPPAPTALFTMEMTREQVLRRMLGRLSGINTDNLMVGDIPDNQSEDYWNGTIWLQQLAPRLLIDDSQNVSIYQMMNKIRRAKRDFGIVAAFVDYAGLIDSEGVDEDSRHKVLGKMVRLLHGLGMVLKIPILIGAQQNRSGGGKKDIAESYEMVHHAQGMIFIQDAHENQDPAALIKEKKVLLAKQRGGRAGWAVRQLFEHHTQRITDKQGYVRRKLPPPVSDPRPLSPGTGYQPPLDGIDLG